MKTGHKLSYLAIFVATAAAFSAPASAQMGRIDFYGKIKDSGCTPAVNGGAQNGVVILPQADVTDFPNADDMEHWTPFKIDVTGCNPTMNNVWAYFSQFDANPSTGNLDNTGSATGIDLQLTDGNENIISVWQNPLVVEGPNEALDANGDATLDYGVQYHRMGMAPVTPGSVVSSVQYSLQFN